MPDPAELRPPSPLPPAGGAPDLRIPAPAAGDWGQVACRKLGTSKSPFLKLLSFLFGSFLPPFFLVSFLLTCSMALCCLDLSASPFPFLIIKSHFFVSIYHALA